MAALVPIFPDTILYPAFTILSKANQVSHNERLELSQLLQNNFKKATGLSLKGRTKFCNDTWLGGKPLTQAQLVSHQFFKSMQNDQMGEALYEKALNEIVPWIRESIGCVKEFTIEEDPIIDEWMAKVLGTVLSSDEIKNCWIPKTPLDKKGQSYLEWICSDLLCAVNDKDITKEDLSVIIASIKEGDIVKCDKTVGGKKSLIWCFAKVFLAIVKNLEHLPEFKTHLVNVLSGPFRERYT